MTDLTDSDLRILLDGIRNDDEEALNRFWALHFDRLTRLASQRVSPKVRRFTDGEDVALSAIQSFIVGLSRRRFDGIKSQNELWKMLTTMVVRRVSKQHRKENAQRRGGGQVRGESVFIAGPDGEKNDQGLANVSRATATPDLEVEFLEICERFFEALGDEKTREVARLYMEGYSLDDIADELGCVRRTVERKLKSIREICSHLTAK